MLGFGFRLCTVNERFVSHVRLLVELGDSSTDEDCGDAACEASDNIRKDQKHRHVDVDFRHRAVAHHKHTATSYSSRDNERPKLEAVVWVHAILAVAAASARPVSPESAWVLV